MSADPPAGVLEPRRGGSPRSGAACRPERRAPAAASSRSRDESAASATPAAHPSVRSRRASASFSESSRPPRAATARVSSLSSASSVAPTSVRSPLARRRPRRIPGSPRVISTSCEPAGTRSAMNARIERLLLAVIRSTSSSTSRNGSRSLRSASKSGSTASTIPGDRRDSVSARSPRRGLIRSRAAAIRASSTTGSLSPRASCTQLPGRGSRALHCATSVDLPYPAGAETSTTRLRCAASPSAERRGRGTASARTGGTLMVGASSGR